MFKDETELMEFICEGEDVIVNMVVTEAIKDAFLYEDENFVKAMDSYVEMLETDKVDEKLEEHLSTVISAYVDTNADIFESLFEAKKGPTPTGPRPIPKPKMTWTGVKQRVKMKKAQFTRDAKRGKNKLLATLRARKAKVGDMIKSAYGKVASSVKSTPDAIKAGLAWAKGMVPKRKVAAAATA